MKEDDAYDIYNSHTPNIYALKPTDSHAVRDTRSTIMTEQNNWDSLRRRSTRPRALHFSDEGGEETLADGELVVVGDGRAGAVPGKIGDKEGSGWWEEGDELDQKNRDQMNCMIWGNEWELTCRHLIDCVSKSS
jgi:hypothetical protein